MNRIEAARLLAPTTHSEVQVDGDCYVAAVQGVGIWVQTWTLVLDADINAFIKEAEELTQ